MIRIRIYTNADCLWSKRVLFRLSSKDSWRGRENDILLEICSNDADVAVKVRKKLFSRIKNRGLVRVHTRKAQNKGNRHPL